jgi:transposase InsO family protein
MSCALAGPRRHPQAHRAPDGHERHPRQRQSAQEGPDHHPRYDLPTASDLVKRDFSVGAPGPRTFGDITYIPTDEGWLYLADVLDLVSRRLVGFAMDERMPTGLVAWAMKMAIAARGGTVAGMVFRHDRGTQ